MYYCHNTTRTSDKSSGRLSTEEILESTGDYWNLLQITGDYWNLLQITGDYWNLLQITGDYWNLLEITGDYWNLLDNQNQTTTVTATVRKSTGSEQYIKA